jgi:hypothetical protein
MSINSIADTASSAMNGQVVLDDQECPMLNKSETKMIFRCQTQGRHLEFRYSGTDALFITKIHIFQNPGKFLLNNSHIFKMLKFISFKQKFWSVGLQKFLPTAM